MTKTQLIQLAGSQANLARILKISRASVSVWKEKIPLLRLYQLKELKPEWFKGQI